MQVQATSRLPGTTKDVRALMAHEAFDIRNPNKVYSLVRAFCAPNPKHFHAADDSGYKLAADVILQRLTLSGGVNANGSDRLAMTDNIIQGTGLVVNGGTELRVTRITFSGTTGIRVAASASGYIADNDIRATATGLNLSVAFTGLIFANDIRGAATGVIY